MQELALCIESEGALLHGRLAGHPEQRRARASEIDFPLYGAAVFAMGLRYDDPLHRPVGDSQPALRRLHELRHHAEVDVCEIERVVDRRPGKHLVRHAHIVGSDARQRRGEASDARIFHRQEMHIEVDLGLFDLDVVEDPVVLYLRRMSWIISSKSGPPASRSRSWARLVWLRSALVISPLILAPKSANSSAA